MKFLEFLDRLKEGYEDCIERLSGHPNISTGSLEISLELIVKIKTKYIEFQKATAEEIVLDWFPRELVMGTMCHGLTDKQRQSMTDDIFKVLRENNFSVIKKANRAEMEKPVRPKKDDWYAYCKSCNKQSVLGKAALGDNYFCSTCDPDEYDRRAEMEKVIEKELRDIWFSKGFRSRDFESHAKQIADALEKRG